MSEQPKMRLFKYVICAHSSYRLLNLFLSLALVTGASSVHACSGVAGKPFAELLKAGGSVAIVRILAQKVTYDDEFTRVDRSREEPVSIILSPAEVVAQIRVSEVLTGPEPAVREITFSNSWCGGHRLDTGGYYLVVVDPAVEHLALGYLDQSVLKLGQEYSEIDGSDKSSSLIVEAVKEYDSTGVFPAETTLPMRPFLAIKGFEAPSAEVYLQRQESGGSRR